MPPKTGHSASQRHPFKPPRPVSSSSASAARQATRPTVSSKKSNSTAVAASSQTSGSDLGAGDVVDDAEESDTQMRDRPATHAAHVDQPGIPPKLLLRIMHEHFKHEDTRVSKEALAVLCKYVDMFTMEAVGRANEVRDEAVRSGQSTEDGFLDVEDLEKLAPQLLMDF